VFVSYPSICDNKPGSEAEVQSFSQEGRRGLQCSYGRRGKEGEGGGRREGGKFQCSDGRRGRREGRKGRGSRLVDERTKIRWQGKEVRGRQEAALEKR
jgi:hypothetical protein